MAIALGSFWARSESDRAEKLAQDVLRLEAERAELQRVVERLNVEQRVAEIEVLQQNQSDDGRALQTILRFTELDRKGRALPSRVFGIPGDVPHFDALVIKFETGYVEQGDSLRGQSLALFRRIYSDSQAPDQGFRLDPSGDIPDVYRVNPAPSEFEAELWRDFWSYARDPGKARAAGVRVAQGEAVYAPMAPGERWVLTLEADGGLNLVRDEANEAAASGDLSAEGKARLSSPPPLATSAPNEPAAPGT
jgi:hypothetical protein